MQTMYDKLGDLLSEALKTGQLPKSESGSEKVSFFYVPKQEEQPEKKSAPSSDSEQQNSGEKERTKRCQNNDFFRKAEKPTGVRIPREQIIPEEVKTALAFIGINENTSYEDAKKAYREKLLYYHPDRRGDNPVLQKVAKEKTTRLLKEWEILETWYENKNTN